MKNAMIFPHKRTWRSRLDLEYLDETSERKISLRVRQEPEAEHTATGKKLRQFADYASKETLGQVHAGGFLHQMILVNADGSNTSPSKLTNAERKKRIADSWFRHIRKFPTSSENPVIQHRLIFSMSRQLHDRLVESGINPDRVLQSTMKKVMGKFADRFHAADAIGYAYGIHHDTDNLHVHVALCPRTAKGKYVGCSMSHTAASGNKNQMTYLRKCFEQENKRWGELLSSPTKLQQHLSERVDCDKLVFSPRLNQQQMETVRNTQTFEAIRLQQLFRSIRNLEAAIAAKRKRFADEKNLRFFSRLARRRIPKVVQAVSKVSQAMERRSLGEMQKLLFKTKTQYRTLHKRYCRLHGFTSHANRNTIQHSHRQQNAL